MREQLELFPQPNEGLEEYTIMVVRYPNGRGARGVMVEDTVMARTMQEARRKAAALRRERYHQEQLQRNQENEDGQG